jgi:arginyl-tRNA--protein-N-Asp/Glu arginylyltransferase
MKVFFSTELAPCPYLAGRLERRLVGGLGGADADLDHDVLLRAGFRRSQRFAYRPACPGCSACVPVRIPVERFVLTRKWRRILHRNQDLTAEERPPLPTAEQFALFERYLDGRHGDSGMVGMTWSDYQAMVAETSVDSSLVEWRGGGGELMAVSLTDRTRDALSGVYKFYEPDQPKRSLGSHVILWHVHRARELGLDHVYLGYWIAGSPKMAYKARFQPLERLTPEGWLPFIAAAEEDRECTREVAEAPVEA